MTLSQLPMERRRSQRILCDAPVILLASAQRFVSTLIDVSLNGALVKRPHDWPETFSGTVDIAIQFDGKSAQIHMRARSIHVQQDCLGFRCEYMDIDSVALLHRLLELTLEDPDLLKRQFDTLSR